MSYVGIFIKIHNYYIIYTDNSVIIDKELDDIYDISSIFCTMFNLKNLSNIDSNRIEYIHHIVVYIPE